LAALAAFGDVDDVVEFGDTGIDRGDDVLGLCP